MDHFIDIGQHRFLLKALPLKNGTWTAIVHVRRLNVDPGVTASVIYRLHQAYSSEHEARDAALALAIRLASGQSDSEDPDG
ncbi:hypothetical protein [Paracidovorax citrulli]